MQPLQRRLRELRRERGLSQRQAAARIGVRKSSISRWEGGLVVPNAENLRKIAKAYSADFEEYFMDRTESARQIMRLEGRLQTMNAERRVVTVQSMGKHKLELMDDGTLLVDNKIMVLPQ